MVLCSAQVLLSEPRLRLRHDVGAHGANNSANNHKPMLTRTRSEMLLRNPRFRHHDRRQNETVADRGEL